MFWGSWVTTRLARGWGWNWYRVKEGTFLHLLEQSRALSDQYFSSYEFFNLFLFPDANGILIKIWKTSITSDIVNQSAWNLVWSLKMEGLNLCFIIIQIWAYLPVGWLVSWSVYPPAHNLTCLVSGLVFSIMRITITRVEGGWGPWYKIPNQVLVPISKSNLMFLKVFKTGPKTKIKNLN